MYKVTNISLEPVFKKYNVSSLDGLNRVQLDEICRDMHISVKVTYDAQYNKAKMISDIDVKRQITADCTASVYMGDSYWEEPQKKIFEEHGGYAKTKTFTSGEQAYDFWEECQLGLNYLKPGRSAEMNWTRRWIDEMLVNFPIMDILRIEDLETGIVLKRVTEDTGKTYKIVEVKKDVPQPIETPVAQPTETPIIKPINAEPKFDVRQLKWTELRAMAKTLNIAGLQGMNKEQLTSAVLMAQTQKA